MAIPEGKRRRQSSWGRAPAQLSWWRVRRAGTNTGIGCFRVCCCSDLLALGKSATLAILTCCESQKSLNALYILGGNNRSFVGLCMKIIRRNNLHLPNWILGKAADLNQQPVPEKVQRREGICWFVPMPLLCSRSNLVHSSRSKSMTCQTCPR